MSQTEKEQTFDFVLGFANLKTLGEYKEYVYSKVGIWSDEEMLFNMHAIRIRELQLQG